VEVEFLGGRIRLPTGPYVMAAVLGCPMYLTFGLHTAPDRYDLYCEPFAERVILPRRDRDEAIRQYAQRYADRLADHCEKAPLNWFNFYDYWIDDEPRLDAAPGAEEGPSGDAPRGG
jgi:predicted LPLAT superfamily acyltransferase